MKIMVDENIPRMTVQALRDRGHDVRDVRGTSDQGAADSDLWQIALSEKRLFITTDRGFGSHRHEPNYGILIVRLRQPNRHRLHERVMEAMSRIPAAEWSSLLVPEVTHLQLYVGTAAPINGLVRHYNLRRGSNVADAAHHGAATKVVEVPPGPPVLATLVAEVYGPNHEERERVAQSVRDVFMSTDGVVDVDCMVEAPQRKLVFDVDRETLVVVPLVHFMVEKRQHERALPEAWTVASAEE